MELNKYLAKPYGAETKKFRDNGGIVLSPSSISKYFENAGEWWDDRNGIISFDGNTSTVLGNAVHGSIDSYYDGEGFISEEDVHEWISVAYAEQMDTVVGYSKATKSKPSGPIAKVDREAVMADYTQMMNAWLANYGEMYPKPDFRERAIDMHVKDGMKLAGTFDMYEEKRKVLGDWKTTGKLPSSMSKPHRFQLTTYAVALIAEGIEVETIRVIYIVRPTKTLPARVAIFEEELTDEMLMEQVRIIENMKKSINAVRDNPELEDIVFRKNILSQWS